MPNHKPSASEILSKTIFQYIREHREWSMNTFGPNDHLEGLLKHIQEEIQEIREAKSRQEQLMEIIDIIILSIDAAWRIGFPPDEIVSVLIEKQNINRTRKYPRITDESQPTRHIKSEGDEQ
jgi:predicted house-cleaning noncanonical NTP pyrophosphatase (MazG superfamily)